MKRGIFVYQVPPMFGAGITGVNEAAFSKHTLMGFGKSRRFLENLKKELDELGYPVIVERDDTEADFEKIAARNYDFIIAIPGLQHRIILKDELPEIFYIDSVDYHNSLVAKTIGKIKSYVL